MMLKKLLPNKLYEASEPIPIKTNIYIPKLKIEKRTPTVFFPWNNLQITNEQVLRLSWQSEDKEFLKYNPKIYLFRWKKNVFRKTDSYKVTYTIKKFYHPPHNVATPNGDGTTTPPRITEWALPPEGEQIPILLKIDDWFRYRNNVYFLKGFGSNPRSDRYAPKLTIAFAIVIEKDGVKYHGDFTKVVCYVSKRWVIKNNILTYETAIIYKTP